LVTGDLPTFVLTVKNDTVEVERWGELSLDPDSNRYIGTVINTYSTYIRVASVSAYTSVYVATVVTNAALTDGSDGSAANVGETNTEWNNAVARFVSVDEELVINMVNMTTASVVNTAITYCENAGNRFLVIDPVTVTSGADALTSISGYSASSYAAVYYPKLIMVDPSKSGSSAMRTTAPGGALLGLYSRVEAERTVAKAAAGFAYDLRGALGLETSFTEVEQGTLYDAHINTLKAIPGAGVIVYGARTLKKTDITKYIPVRRSLNYVKSQAKLITNFAVFEPNNDGLWGSINTRLSKFLSAFWSSGGLKGRTSSEAYYITCNSTNNTSQTIENGEVHIEIGVALQTPAEFIVINVSQFIGSAEFNETV